MLSPNEMTNNVKEHGDLEVDDVEGLELLYCFTYDVIRKFIDEERFDETRKAMDLLENLIGMVEDEWRYRSTDDDEDALSVMIAENPDNKASIKSTFLRVRHQGGTIREGILAVQETQDHMKLLLN